MGSSFYIRLKPELNIEIKQAESSFKNFGSYVRLNGLADKATLYNTIKKSLGLYHQTFNQNNFLPGDGKDNTESSAVFTFRINERNFSSYDNPALEVWSWLRNEPLKPFFTSNPYLYHTYLIKISGKEYWFLTGYNEPVCGIDHLTENRFYHLLNQTVSSPDLDAAELNLLSPREENLVNEYGKSSVNFPRKRTIVDLFEEKAALQLNAPVVFANDAWLSCGELNAQANQLAHYLKGVGIVAESLVPFCMTRSSKMLVAILGILKAGGAYVPIDPGYPKERIQYIISDTAASIVITDDPSFQENYSNPNLLVIDLNKDWPAIGKGSVENLHGLAKPGLLAYVIYTSGTTGRPKGVMIEHKALMDHCYGVIKNAGLEKCKSFALFSPLVFDAGHSIIHSAFILGASLHVLSSELIADGKKLYQYFNKHSIDCLKIVPSLWLSYALDDNPILAKKVMIFGGESFSSLLLDKLKACRYTGAVYNHYGPTEATIGKSIYQVRIDKEYQVVPVGKPFSNTRFYVTDQQGKQVPIGVPGELCIAGEGLARGYLNQPETTNKFFVTDPFSKVRGSKMYKTGDVVKWLGDGNLEYLGRKDEQVKIRGHRIELTEIETLLNECLLVKQAVVVYRKNNGSGNRLEAFIITTNHSRLNSIKDFMQNRLPDYMVPVTWHLIERFPLTINGKIDKKALEQNFAEVPSTLQHTTPGTPLQIQLAEIWKRLFEKERISIDANFIEAGGHSLLAMRMVSAIRKELHTELSIASIFKHPSIALLSAHIQNHRQATAFAALIKQAKPQRIPLSFSQGSLWFIHQATGSLQYHLPFSFVLKGSIDKYALNSAFTNIIQRHEVLRTVIRQEDGEGYQLVLPADNWQLDLVDGNAFNTITNTQETFIKNFIGRPFDLAKEPMIRAALITDNNGQHKLVYVLHHIAFDGWSSSIFQKELVENYSAITKGHKTLFKELPIQYSDYAIWQQDIAKAGLWNDQLAFWKKKLSGTNPLQLPTDYTRPALQSSAGGRVNLVIPQNIYHSLQVVSKQNGATLFMTLASVLNILLHRYTNQQDISIGTPTAGRNQQVTEPLIGYFINTLVLRNELSADLSFIDLLKHVTATTLQAFEHQDVPFEKVVEITTQERDVSRSPLFQVMLVLQNLDAEEGCQLGDAFMKPSTTAVDLQATSMFDATFIISESTHGLQISLEYATALFKHSTAERMVGHFSNILKSIVLDPKCRIGKLDLLSKEEKHRLLVDFNPKTAPESKNETILDFIEQQVSLHPNNIAATFEGQSISYIQLAERSDKLTAYLKSLGVYQKLVPVLIDHSVDLLVSILAVLKAGAAYVPIDAEYPSERIQFILEDTGATLLLCSRENRQKIKGEKKIEIIEVDGDWELGQETFTPISLPKLEAEHLAYVIYTSGSTGQPKGTLITHKGLATSSASRRQFYGNTGSMLFIPSFSFDSSVGVIFGTLISGGTLVLCRHHQIKEPQVVRRLLQNTHTILCVPSYYRFLLEDGIIQSGNISRVIVAGENLDASLVNKHFAETNNCKLYNEYGPTEATVWSTVAEIEPGKNITIGRPIDTTRLYILNSNLHLVPEGVAGELCIGGPQVAKGYLNLKEKTNEKFVNDPFETDGQNNMYKTGDLARWLTDGQLEYLGRIDDQVKIRGYRVEPAGIEHALNECKGILQSVVVTKPQSDFTNRLVAYIMVDGEFNPAAYTRFLKERLPLFMVPEQWVQVQNFTLTPNGKIDKKALPDVELIELKSNNHTAPKPGLQQDLAEIWQQLLSLNTISVYDNFFTLGGHSLLAMRLVSAITKKLNVDVSINELFKYHTIAEMAVFIEKKTVNPTQYTSNFKYLVKVKEGGNKVPLYIVAGGGSTALRFKNFSEMLDADQPVYVFQSPVDEEHLIKFPSTIEQIATTFLNELFQQNPHGPYALSGHCIGGIIAFAMAKQLQALGMKVHTLILFDTVLQDGQKLSSSAKGVGKRKWTIDKLISTIALKVQFEYFLLTKHPHSFFKYRLQAIQKLLKSRKPLQAFDQHQEESGLDIFEKSETIYAEARAQYMLIHYNGPIFLFLAKERYYFIDVVEKIKFKKLSSADQGNTLWKAYCTKLFIIETEGNHSDMFNKVHGTEFSRRLQETLDMNK
ncbi:MAG: amino acid adenylation domain-containing protein [Chitinophagaceae bacterium]|nr:amino acid adenylation domain-containing protein [Chitinophagaceae bacterium]